MTDGTFCLIVLFLLVGSCTALEINEDRKHIAIRALEIAAEAEAHDDR